MEKLELQLTCFNNIKALCENYRKDSSSRKQPDYLNKRLSSLEDQWKDFDTRHAELLLELEDKTIQYFANDVHSKLYQMYLAVKTDMTNRIKVFEEQKLKVDFDLTGIRTDFDEDTSNIQHLLNKQESGSHTTTAKWQLEDHLATLKSKWEPVDKLHWEIDFILKGSNEKYYEYFSNIEQKYDELRNKINNKLWSTIHYQQSAPRIEIPEFQGNPNAWISFKDLFLEAVHNNPTISTAQKMQHLKTKLRGEAERLVQHLTISAENYNSCWEILSQRYDNRRLQFTSFMNTILNLPIIQNPDAYNLKRMHDVITECLNGLSNIGIDTSSWDPIIVHLMSLKLDSTTFNDYIKSLQDHRELPHLNDFLFFLEGKFMAFEAIRSAKKDNTPLQKFTYSKPSNSQNPVKKENYDSRKSFTKTYYTSYGKCPNCNKNHVMMQCPTFIGMDTTQRNNIVTKLQLCKNCLFSHGNEECKCTRTCKECNLKHHTLLHNSAQNNVTNGNNNFLHRPHSSSQQQSSNHLSNTNTEVLLTTVLLKIKSHDGTYVTLRALLDQGSQVNLISENAAQLLRLPRKKLNATVSGIGSVSGSCRGRTQLTCYSIHSDYYFEVDALVMKKLTNNLPNSTFKKTNWPHLENLQLADPEYNISRPVDLLLGADIYSQIILDGVLKGNLQSPVALHTHLGWVLCGKTDTFNCHATLINLQELTKFWESEQIYNTDDFSKDDECEQFYKDTLKRGQDGKYIVKMPLCQDYEKNLGKSKSIAVSQFLQLEKRLKKQHRLACKYREFIKEYIDLGHMKLASPISTYTPSCYLPHHGVLRNKSTTTKLRVVFNASQKNSTGLSLNSFLKKGPNLQKDIQALIIVWRTFKYAFTADIEKMYRCIWISEEQQQLLKIVWRDSPDEVLREYQLCTVTYGTKCAPWLAMRTLQQLAIDDGHKYPAAAKILCSQFYVDDVISGHNSLDEAKKLQRSLIELLRGGGMNLRKWSSNNPALLEELSTDQISTQTSFDFKTEESSKTLGLGWNPSTDTFNFNWPITEDSNAGLTKRALLSEVSKFYDPLGWLSPVTVLAKLIFQRLWMSKLDWDDEVPIDIKSDWLKLKMELPCVKDLTLNRCIGDTQQQIELIGFCDSSQKAYAAVIYSRVKNDEGLSTITLLVSRTRVAPLSQKTTLPRLELCGAQLLAELMKKTIEALPGYNTSVQAWCDSQVVLAWIQGDTFRWDTYVANRVSKIKNIIPPDQWYYVKSEQNPADCASRGLSPRKLMNFSLWWQGPSFLKENSHKIDNNIPTIFETNMGCINHAHITQNATTATSDSQHFITMLLNKYNSITRINRLVAWILRFITTCRNKRKSETVHLTTNELTAANEYILMHVQRLQFCEEYKQLIHDKTVNKRSPIHKLSPYLDNKGIIRVGGRLNNSYLPFEMKNPVIVPHAGRFTQLLIEWAHLITLHGGARLTLTYLRQRYWIVGGNRAVKSQLQRCVRCHRSKQTNEHQLMANLPPQRSRPSRPFTHSAVDFSGNVDIKLNKGRGVKTSKGYIAVFVCMATKAVHLELVSDLSTETFIAALQRLCARRGTPKHMYSDCGTNFIGAAKVLRREFEEFNKILSLEFFDQLATMEIEWHFNAPAWPSAGGLWEAAVKSMKYHLRRVLGEQKLTYEEFATLLAKIEACMNSRPLCALTENPDEFYNCLTPGHFLTGSPTMSLPMSDYSNINNIDIRQRWQLTEHMLHQYWKTWSNEYLTQQQKRSKWNTPTENIKEGTIVLIKDNNLPPGKWALGRVLETHPGSDGYVRVVTLKTKTGIIKRPIVKLSQLPLETEIEEQLPAK